MILRATDLIQPRVYSVPASPSDKILGADSGIAGAAADFGFAVIEPYHYDGCDEGNAANSQCYGNSKGYLRMGGIDVRFDQADRNRYSPRYDRLVVV